MRAYRDEWLVNQVGGLDLIKEYYKVAPRIVEMIDARTDVADYYDRLWIVHLAPICSLIRARDMERALEQYAAMVAKINVVVGLSERHANVLSTSPPRSDRQKHAKK